MMLFKSYKSMVIMLCLFSIFTLLNLEYSMKGLISLAFLLPGLIGNFYLENSKSSFDDLYLQIKKPSLSGLPICLIYIGLLYVITIHKNHLIINWKSVGAACIVSAVAQEIFFRSYLLGYFNKQGLTKTKSLVMQAILFSFWHVREFIIYYHGIESLFIMMGLLFLVGLLWGIHTFLDKTVWYVTIVHIIFLFFIRLID